MHDFTAPHTLMLEISTLRSAASTFFNWRMQSEHLVKKTELVFHRYAFHRFITITSQHTLVEEQESLPKDLAISSLSYLSHHQHSSWRTIPALT